MKKLITSFCLWFLRGKYQLTKEPPIYAQPYNNPYNHEFEFNNTTAIIFRIFDENGNANDKLFDLQINAMISVKDADFLVKSFKTNNGFVPIKITEFTY